MTSNLALHATCNFLTKGEEKVRSAVRIDDDSWTTTFLLSGGVQLKTCGQFVNFERKHIVFVAAPTIRLVNCTVDIIRTVRSTVHRNQHASRTSSSR
mmetsp:Transcript_7930/g.23408  ORF Transcript_7930/g.23408 Transcript_7930/m.23408 type:complete len:97 (+) Transcript_7930:1-291(+)